MSIDDSMSIHKKIARYAKSTNAITGVVARIIGENYLDIKTDKSAHAKALMLILGDLKGPMMKIAQLLSTVPGSLPDEYMQELSKLQCNAPHMGWLFVKRRMRNELGDDWLNKFDSFDKESFAAASLGQVHRATYNGMNVACKLQYPDMLSQVDADMKQFRMFLKLYEKTSSTILTDNIFNELKERIEEELDYKKESENIKIFQEIFNNNYDFVRVPRCIEEISTQKLISMDYLEGDKVENFANSPQEIKDEITLKIFKAWYIPLFSAQIIHGDPHMGNYTIDPELNINLLDFGCVRRFSKDFVAAVVLLYRALLEKDKKKMAQAYEGLGFKNLNHDLIEALNIWAEFLFNPLIDDKKRLIHAHHGNILGREVIAKVMEQLRESGGGVNPPKEFIMIDRAAVGIGAVAMKLNAKNNWHRLFEEVISL